MTRKTFENNLKALEDKLIALGECVGHAVGQAVAILLKRDREAAQRLVDADHAVNEMRYGIENDTLVLMATQQPMARDLRWLAAVLEIATELERVGDYAKGIAKITIQMGDEPFVKPLIDIPLMAQKAQAMLTLALKAFVDRDAELARGIPLQDAEIDALYKQVFKDLVGVILAEADPTIIERASFLMWVAHNLERTGDRVVNVCERVIFTVTGELVEMG
jgi:phosphate transport system protein